MNGRGVGGSVALLVAAGVLGLVAGARLPALVAAFPPHEGPARRAVPSAAVLSVLTAAVCVLVAARLHRPAAQLPAYLALAVVGVALAAIDLRAHRLPDVLTLPSYPVLAALLGLAALVTGDGDRWWRACTAAAACVAFFLAMSLPRGGVGFGDVKLGGLLGFALGWLGWDEVVLGLAIGMLAAGVVAAGLVATRRADRSSALPYGPFLLVGALVAALLA